MHYKYIFENQLFSLLLISLLCGLILLQVSSANAGISVTDNQGRVLDLAQPAQRVVSLSPHITENLFLVGAGGRIVGVTSHSDYPAEALKLPVIGGFDTLNIEAILALQPDLVIAWPDGNPALQLQRLEALGVPVYYSAPARLEGIPTDLRNYGRLTGSESAQQVADKFQAKLQQLQQRYVDSPSLRVFYQLWHKPLMTINRSQLIDQIITLCGGQNLFSDHAEAIPQLSVESVLSVDPEVILTGQKNVAENWSDLWRQWDRLSATRYNQFYQLNEDLLYRPTVRMIDGAEQMCQYLQQARDAQPKTMQPDE